MNIYHLTVELVVGFFFLFFVVRVLGKKLINQINPFTFIAAIVLSEILGNALYEDGVNILYVMYSMSIWGLLLIIVEYIGQKLLKPRLLFEGKPSVLIKNGVINREELKKNRINLNQLQSMLRQSETFSVREVAYCYLEANGSLSILKKTKFQELIQDDIKIPPSTVYVPLTFIRDGEILQDELLDAGYTESWLKNELLRKGIKSEKDVFLAEWLEGDGFFVQEYKNEQS